MVDSAQKNIQA